MHDAIHDHPVVLAVVHHGQSELTGVFQGTAHQIIVLDAMTVIGQRHHASLGQRTNRRQFFALNSLTHRTGDLNSNYRRAGLFLDEGHSAG